MRSGGTQLLDCAGWQPASCRLHRARLALGISLSRPGGGTIWIFGRVADPAAGYSLAIPNGDDNLNRLFAGSDFHKGGWTLALKLKQAPETEVLSVDKALKTVTLVDLKGYDAWVEPG